MGANRVVVGRQAIQDRAGVTVGYELLFRPSASADAAASDVGGVQMTADVVFGALNIGLDHVAHGRTIFCNADRAVIVGELPITLPAEQTVVEVMETIDPDDEVLAGCRRLVAQGYRLALDNFTWFDDAPLLLDLAHIVKINVMTTRGPELTRLLERLARYDVRLLAEKVETEDELAEYRRLGFDLFQGYVIERPVVVSGRTIEAGPASRIQLAASLTDHDFDFDELEVMLRSDPGLAWQVMRLASVGPLGGTRRTINSVRDALVLAGARRLQNWMALLLARPERPADADAFPKALVRARACELLGGRLGREQASMGYAAGLLSALDLLFGIPPDEVRQTLPISDDLAEAAFGTGSELARIVRDVVDYQLEVPGRQRRSDVTEQELDDAFAQAFAWTMRTSAVLDL